MKTNGLFVALAILSAFAACEKEHETEISKPCILTVEATKVEDDVTKALSEESGRVLATWEINDEVTVYDSGDNELGTIRATSAGQTASFTGTLNSTPGVGNTLYLRYKAPSYATQDGTLSYIAANCDYAEALVTVVAADMEYGTAVTSKANFSNKQAIVKFTLKDQSGNDLPVTGLTIGDGVNTYTVTPDAATNVLYVAMRQITSKNLTLVASSEKYGYSKTGVSFPNAQFYTRTVRMKPYYTVGASTHVLFAPGNLQATYDATGKTWSWGFAAHQYDAILNNPGNSTITTTTKEISEPYAKLSADGTVDLFGWSTSLTYYGIATNSQAEDLAYSGDFVDWGTLAIGTYPANYWRTLTIDEVTYLLETRSTSTIGETSNARYLKAQVTDANIPGLILFPDSFTWNVSAFGTAPTTCNSGTAYYTAVSFSTEQWTAMEAAGCVFLPRCGYRQGTSFNLTSGGVLYWSSTPGANTKASALFVTSTVLNTTSYNPATSLYYDWRYLGRAVRLAREL